MQQGDPRLDQYQITVFPPGGSFGADQRRRFVELFDEVTEEIWNKPNPRLFRDKEDTLFRGDVGVGLIEASDEIVGFSIFRRLELEGARVLYHAALNIRPAHQGKGLRNMIVARVLKVEQARCNGPLYYAWRTRSPVVWFPAAQKCRRIVPCILGGEPDAELVALGRLVAAELYPAVGLETPSMIMRNVYKISYKVEPQHSDPVLNAAFLAALGTAGPADAIFSIGELDRARIEEG